MSVLVACDSVEPAPAGFARVLAGLLGSRVVLVNVRSADGLVGGEGFDEHVPLLGARVERASSAAAGLQRLIASERPVVTVLGSSRDAPHGRVRVGTTIERVLHGAPSPVAVVPRGRAERGLSSVAVGLLPNPDSLLALRFAAWLARLAAVPLLVLAVLRRSPSAADAAAYAACVAPAFSLSGSPARILRTAIRSAAQTPAAPHAPVADTRPATGAPDLPLVEPVVLIGDPADALVRFSSRVGLLVLGSRSYGPGGVVLPGGVARRVLREASCPVLLVPRASVPAPMAGEASPFGLVSQGAILQRAILPVPGAAGR